MSLSLLTAQALHYEFIRELCESGDLVVDMCYRTKHTMLARRWLGESVELCWHIHLSNFPVSSAVEFAGKPSPRFPSVEAIRAAVARVSDAQLRPVMRLLQFRRDLVLLLKSALCSSRPWRIARDCNRLAAVLNAMGSRRDRLFEEHYVLSGEFDTLMFWLGKLIWPHIGKTDSVVVPLPNVFGITRVK
jgi:hypothetical protein